MLAAVGILGASIAPFLVGGEPGAPFWLHGYFGTVAMAGLTINILRKWRWIGGVSLFVPYGAAAIVMIGLGGPCPLRSCP
ncbi:DUF2339 domain-containing protein [Notoacmeibacter marinus]|uniref:DUF2339 domain-containing protein n=1 Tax=Notoacmeibacter marinus TaxID=1876515 RepID=UPI000DF16409|nr:DUF2339 domain-containing protein [Notoacmeibacter marinus]